MKDDDKIFDAFVVPKIMQKLILEKWSFWSQTYFNFKIYEVINKEEYNLQVPTHVKT